MPNKHKGEVGLTLDGKEYVLRMTILKYSILKDEGIDMLKDGILEHLNTQLPLFFAMVKGQHGIESIEDADELMTDNYQQCKSAAAEAVTLFFQKLSPEAQESEPENEKK